MRNEYEVRGESTAILIKRKGIILETIIDTAQLEKAGNIEGRWFADFFKKQNIFYVCFVRGTEKIYLHRLLMNNPIGLLVDHQDGNTLNNRYSNLRLANKSQNAQNLNKLNKKNTSGVRGVVWHKAANKWAARIKVNYKEIHLGLFTDITEAEKAVCEARASMMPFSKEARERNENSK